MDARDAHRMMYLTTHDARYTRVNHTITQRRNEAPQGCSVSCLTRMSLNRITGFGRLIDTTLFPSIESQGAEMALLVMQVAVSGELVEVFEMPVDDVDGHRMLAAANEDDRVIHPVVELRRRLDGVATRLALRELPSPVQAAAQQLKESIESYVGAVQRL
ncbi:hypothetical protein E1N52_31945 [Paraburkholderia guartelaensis]|uniref:Uncharacterized protein n=1 Tax=Paraburkholderia guartelaensis TaxID=2546446 RepID=A0A4R5L6N9_9BURK|nr:hypothetical protein [Paraburkholderia guartelaensis]TDG03984.1 hypothetical protein E1N52_31945 [Paraburkholderia guartelaensis]